MKIKRFLTLITFLIPILISCGSNQSDDTGGTVSSILVAATTEIIGTSENTRLSAVLEGNNLTDKSVIWSITSGEGSLKNNSDGTVIYSPPQNIKDAHSATIKATSNVEKSKSDEIKIEILTKSTVGGEPLYPLRFAEKKNLELDLNGKLYTLPVEVFGDYGVYQGDILFDYPTKASDSLLSPQANYVPPEMMRVWPNRQMPYKFDPDFPEKEKVVNAIAIWNKSIANLKIVPLGDGLASKNYLYITESPRDSDGNLKFGCASLKGMNGERQPLYLTTSNSCWRESPQRAILHEFGHAAGLFHEHSHPNRDKYIEIKKENIIADKHILAQFDIFEGAIAGTEYDYGSIMHYGCTTATKNGKATIVPYDTSSYNCDGSEGKIAIGTSAISFSSKDIKAINRRYAIEVLPEDGNYALRLNEPKIVYATIDGCKGSNCPTVIPVPSPPEFVNVSPLGQNRFEISLNESVATTNNQEVVVTFTSDDKSKGGATRFLIASDITELSLSPNQVKAGESVDLTWKLSILGDQTSCGISIDGEAIIPKVPFAIRCDTGIYTLGSFEEGVYTITFEVGFGDTLTSQNIELTVTSSDAPLPTPDTEAPNVALSASSTNVTQTGLITLTAVASDNTGIDRVEFYREGTKLSEDTTEPFTHTITLASADNGTIPFEARAYDAAGNNKADTITITVNVIEPKTDPSGILVAEPMSLLITSNVGNRPSEKYLYVKNTSDEQIEVTWYSDILGATLGDDAKLNGEVYTHDPHEDRGYAGPGGYRFDVGPGECTKIEKRSGIIKLTHATGGLEIPVTVDCVRGSDNPDVAQYWWEVFYSCDPFLGCTKGVVFESKAAAQTAADLYYANRNSTPPGSSRSYLLPEDLSFGANAYELYGDSLRLYEMPQGWAFEWGKPDDVNNPQPVLTYAGV